MLHGYLAGGQAAYYTVGKIGQVHTTEFHSVLDDGEVVWSFTGRPPQEGSV